MMKEIFSEEEYFFFKKQVAVFMKGVHEHGLPNYRSKFSFSAWDDTIEEELDVCVYVWLRSMLRTNLGLFEVECSSYQEDYPQAYLEVKEKIEEKKLYLSRQEKIQMFMKYLNDKNQKVPHGRSGLCFCDINPETKNNTNVGTWLEKHIQQRSSKFLAECLKYQEQYPIAYAKILYYIQKRDKKVLEDTRVQLWLRALEEDLEEKNLRFCEIDKDCLDSILVKTWFLHKIQEDLDSFLKKCEVYQEKFPKGFIKAKKRILNLKNDREREFLSEEARFSYLLKYLDSEENNLSQVLRFCDLDEKIMDSTNVNYWLINYFSKKMDLFLEMISYYSERYPIAYFKLFQRKEQYLSNCVKKECFLSYEDKMEILLNFFNEEEVDKIDSSLRFCDISEGLEDTSNVEIWFRNSMSKDIRRFYMVLTGYRERYPVGYEKMVKILNHSKERVNKSRMLLVEELKQVQELLIREQTFSKKKVRN